MAPRWSLVTPLSPALPSCAAMTRADEAHALEVQEPRALSFTVPDVARRILAAAALTGLVVTSLIIAAGAAAQPSSLVPASQGGFPGWLSGPLHGLGSPLSANEFGVLLLAMCACYVLALLCWEAIDLRLALAAIVVLHAIFLVAPPLFSSDVIGYISYARLGAVHGLDPYTHVPLDAPGDPTYRYFPWHDLTSPYGPLFTIASYALAPLGVAGALWALKIAFALASLGAVALVVACAARIQRPPTQAAIYVGLNPLLLAYGVGGGHNDLLVMLVVIAAVYLALSERQAWAAGGAVGAAALKASAAIVLPFMLIGARRRWPALRAAAAAGGIVGALAIAAFGSGAVGFLTVVGTQQELVALHSVPNYLGRLLGLGGLTSGLRAAAIVVLTGALGVLLARTWRGRDWVSGAGWATFTLLVTSAWLLPWYVIWLLPLAALGDSARLRLATLGLAAFIVALRVPFIEHALTP